MKWKDRLFFLAVAALTVSLLVCSGKLIARWKRDQAAERAFAQLEELSQNRAKQDAGTQGGAPTEENRPDFTPLVERNPDFVGWLTIEGTPLDYPVVQRPSDPDFYLEHDFDGQYSKYGVPYLDANCTLDSENLVIYGHNMKTGTMFGYLTEYASQDAYAEHPLIRLDTLQGGGDFQIFGSFSIDVEEEPLFLYNTYIQLDETAFEEFVRQVKERSDVDSSITPQYGDQLLTLSTCEYSSTNGRYVVCARRIIP